MRIKGGEKRDDTYFNSGMRSEILQRRWKLSDYFDGRDAEKVSKVKSGLRDKRTEKFTLWALRAELQLLRDGIGKNHYLTGAGWWD